MLQNLYRDRFSHISQERNSSKSEKLQFKFKSSGEVPIDTCLQNSRLNLQIVEVFLPYLAAYLARKLYKSMRRENASICIQKHTRSYAARKRYTKLQSSASIIQTGLRAMVARNDYQYRRRTNAAIFIQVCRYLQEEDSEFFVNKY